MNRSLVCLVAGLPLLVAGCSAPTKESPASEKKPAKAPQPIKLGMNTEDVQRLKGDPDSARPEHGGGGTQLDIWTYKDVTITFRHGIVKEIKSR